jgi:hypothetical protein
VSAAKGAMPHKPRVQQLRWLATAWMIRIRSPVDVNYFSLRHLVYAEFVAEPAACPVVQSSDPSVKLNFHKYQMPKCKYDEAKFNSMPPIRLHGLVPLTKTSYIRDCELINRRMVFKELKYKHAQNVVKFEVFWGFGIHIGALWIMTPCSLVVCTGILEKHAASISTPNPIQHRNPKYHSNIKKDQYCRYSLLQKSVIM